MGFPSDELTSNGRLIDHVSDYLQREHKSQFMVVNLSEKQYDYSKFDDNVLEFCYPGYPSPPLNTLLNMCKTMDAWLAADSSNVLVIHCQTGKGRTASCAAAYLTWSRKFNNTAMALQHVAFEMRCKIDELVVPTQKRYLEYAQFMIDGHTPSLGNVKLARVIMNGIPRFGDNATCRPYLQVFCGTNLVYTSTGRDSTNLREYTQVDNSILFPVDLVLDGDFLVRVRHLYRNKKRCSMLRVGLYAGYVSAGYMRLSKDELDGACDDDRFDDDFNLDLIFAPIGNSDDSDMTVLSGHSSDSFWKNAYETEQKQFVKRETEESEAEAAAAADAIRAKERAAIRAKEAKEQAKAQAAADAVTSSASAAVQRDQRASSTASTSSSASISVHGVVSGGAGADSYPDTVTDTNADQDSIQRRLGLPDAPEPFDFEVLDHSYDADDTDDTEVLFERAARTPHSPAKSHKKRQPQTLSQPAQKHAAAESKLTTANEIARAASTPLHVNDTTTSSNAPIPQSTVAQPPTSEDEETLLASLEEPLDGPHHIHRSTSAASSTSEAHHQGDDEILAELQAELDRTLALGSDEEDQEFNW
jgi:C2 domain of PTEN tumour-suppressor protein/Polymorphic toxin system, DSP-PTPase phosphatase